MLVCHGMGQQVPFESVDGVVRALRLAEECLSNDECQVTATVVKLKHAGGEETLPRAEMTLRGADDRERKVHVYEAYWAPLTEGRVSSPDVVNFLFDAFRNGLQNGTAGRWHRWMFGKIRQFSTGRAALEIVGAYLVVLPLLLINATIAAVAAARVTIGYFTGWPSDALIGDLTVDILLLLIAAAAIIVGSWLPGSYRNKRFAPEALCRNRIWQTWRLSEPIRRVCWVFVWTGPSVPLPVGLLILFHLLWHVPSSAEMTWSRVGIDLFDWFDWRHQYNGMAWRIFTVVTWGLALWTCSAARSYLVQSLGDVAAYVSAYSVNKFWEVRASIKDAALTVARAIYGAKRVSPAGAETEEFEYARVIVVGHSLGSVLAYDTLNTLIKQDLINQVVHDPVLDVVARTELLLTLGSPLDKTAFIFTTQTSTEVQVREALAAAAQPMIVDYAYRPRRWINIWSPNDWIGGPLHYYDDDSTAPNPKRVDNRPDPDACTPLLAHNEYWTNKMFVQALHEGTTST